MGQCTVFHPGVFFLTFLSYATYHIVRKTPSYVQSSLISEWTPVSEHHALGKATSMRHSLFQDQQSAEAFLGILNAFFLFVYAAGNVLSGMAADRMDLRLFLTTGMTLSAVVMFVFGPVLEWTAGYSQAAYIVLQVLNALFQSTGWPCLVPIMASWFSKQSRGYILGLWSSSPSVGSILGALIVSSVVGYGYEYAFVVTSSMLFAVGVLVFLGLVTSPREVSLMTPEDNDCHNLIDNQASDRNNEDAADDDDDDDDDDDILSNGETKILIEKSNTKILYKKRVLHASYGSSDRTDNPVNHNMQTALSSTTTDTPTSKRKAQTVSSDLPVKNDARGRPGPSCVDGRSDKYLKNQFRDEHVSSPEHQSDADLSMKPRDQEKLIVKKNYSRTHANSASHINELFQGDIAEDSDSLSSITTLRAEKDQSLEHNSKDPVQAEPKAISFLGALLLPGVISYSLCFAFLKLVIYVFFFWLPFYLSSSFGWAESTADRLSLWYDVGGIVGATASAFLMSKWNKSALIMTPMIVTAIPVLYIYGVLRVGEVITINALLLFFIGSLLSGTGNILSAAVSADLGQQEALRASTKSMATVTGILEGSGTVGAALGQIMVPYLNAAFGWDSVFYYLMVATCLSALSISPILVSEVKDLKKKLREIISNRHVHR